MNIKKFAACHDRMFASLRAAAGQQVVLRSRACIHVALRLAPHLKTKLSVPHNMRKEGAPFKRPSYAGGSRFVPARACRCITSSETAKE